MKDINFKLMGLTCEACVKLASMRFRKIPGVTEVEVDLSSGETHILSEENIGLEVLEKSLAGTHYSIVK